MIRERQTSCNKQRKAIFQLLRLILFVISNKTTDKFKKQHQTCANKIIEILINHLILFDRKKIRDFYGK